MIGRVLTDIHDHVIDTINSLNDLSDLHDWLAGLYSIRKPLVFALFFGMAWGLFLAVFREGSFNLSYGIGGFLYGVLIGIPIYSMLVMLGLPGHLGRYQYRLYDFAPANSEIISHLSQMFNVTSFAIAAFSATGTLIVSFSQDWRESVGPICAGWIPVIVLFLSSQSALNKIIATAKWRTLDQIQAQIDTLRTEANLTQKETVESINCLIDLQERVVATRNSVFSLRTVLNTLKDLLLPLLASILANWGQLHALFP